mmetsp:Transcript_10574/g.23409  ORF Transcript_10574/g.23409 Transcript_10574/m.23409 type:complete len:258 (-) Transcript_10574:31-804(-)
MPSRKRSKGKARKAKAPNDDGEQQQGRQEREQQVQHHSIPGQLLSELSIVRRCDHGCPRPPDGDVCSKFVVAFEDSMRVEFENGDHSLVMAAVMVSSETINIDSRVWKDAVIRERLRSYLVSIGTDSLLNGNMTKAMVHAITIIMLELSTTSDPIVFNRKLTALTRDLVQDKERETTRFFSKRIGCSCLTERYAQLKTQTKIGECSYCHEEKKRVELMVCQRCRLSQYCSKECQREGWAEHKRTCAKSRASSSTPRA